MELLQSLMFWECFSLFSEKIGHIRESLNFLQQFSKTGISFYTCLHVTLANQIEQNDTWQIYPSKMKMKKNSLFLKVLSWWAQTDFLELWNGKWSIESPKYSR